MYHIGKIVEVISPLREKKIKSADKSVEVVVRMWDENLMIIGAEPKIAKNILSGDYVIADYTPVDPKSPHRKMLISKVLPREMGKKIWNEFQKELSRKKSAMAHIQSQMPPGYR
jgi:hypothetical protein